MKKIISLTCFLLLLSFPSQAQNAQLASNLKEAKTTTCKPLSPEECATKMGISVAEYLALPKKNCMNTATATLDKKASEDLATVAVKSGWILQDKCMGSIGECVKKMGMTVEECKAKCPSKTASVSTLASNDD